MSGRSREGERAPAGERGAGRPWCRRLALALLAGTPISPGLAAQQIVRRDSRFDALVPPGAPVEKIADGFGWLEGPAWDHRDSSLLFSDIPNNSVYRWRAGAVTLFLRPSGYSGPTPFTGREPGSNGLAFDPQGRLVLCQHGDRRVARLETDGRLIPLAERFGGRRLNSPNDVVFGPDGSLYFTDPPFGLPGTFQDPGKELGFSGVYRLSPDGRLTLLTRELNAPQASLSRRTAGRCTSRTRTPGGRSTWLSPSQATGRSDRAGCCSTLPHGPLQPRGIPTG